MINIRRVVIKPLSCAFEDDYEIEYGEFEPDRPEIREDSLVKIKLKPKDYQSDETIYWDSNDINCYEGDYTNSSKVIVDKED